MPELSPAAQAFLEAAYALPLNNGQPHLAAALRAAADQVVPKEVHPQIYEYCCDYSSLRARMDVRTRILAIADELEQLDE